MNPLNGLSAKTVWRVLSVFLFFSVADLLLTWMLIDRNSREVVESNPLAAHVLESFGWAGLAAYKFALVAVIGGLAVIMERQRPLAGLLILVFACGVQGAVVTCSAFLYLENRRGENTDDDALYSTLCLERRQALLGGTLPLLTQKSVQEELDLSDSLVLEIVQLAQKRHELSRMASKASLNECQSHFMVVTAREHSVASQLTHTQTHRLRQLVLQNAGPISLGDADVIATLDYSPQQLEEVFSIIEQYEDEFRPTLSQKNPTDRIPNGKNEIAKLDKRLLNLLTGAQKARWEELLGPPLQSGAAKTSPVSAVDTE